MGALGSTSRAGTPARRVAASSGLPTSLRVGVVDEHALANVIARGTTFDPLEQQRIAVADRDHSPPSIESPRAKQTKCFAGSSAGRSGRGWRWIGIPPCDRPVGLAEPAARHRVGRKQRDDVCLTFGRGCHRTHDDRAVNLLERHLMVGSGCPAEGPNQPRSSACSALPSWPGSCAVLSAIFTNRPTYSRPSAMNGASPSGKSGYFARSSQTIGRPSEWLTLADPRPGCLDVLTHEIARQPVLDDLGHHRIEHVAVVCGDRERRREVAFRAARTSVPACQRARLSMPRSAMRASSSAIRSADAVARSGNSAFVVSRRRRGSRRISAREARAIVSMSAPLRSAPSCSSARSVTQLVGLVDGLYLEAGEHVPHVADDRLLAL